MLNCNYQKRPCAQKLKAHYYFSDVDFSALEDSDDRTWTGEEPWQPARPAFPVFGRERWATLKFGSFHDGLDSTMSPSERVVDEEHQLVPTPWVSKQRALDARDPLVYEFMGL